MKKKTFQLLAAFLVAGGLTSCDVSYFDNEIDDFTWSGEMSVPVGHATYTLSELFEELEVTDIVEANDGSLSIAYTETITDSDTYDVTIENETINGSVGTPVTNAMVAPFSLPLALNGPLADQLNALNLSQTEQTVYDIGLTEELTSAKFNGGTMAVTFNSTFQSQITLDLVIPSFKHKQTGNPYTGQVVLNGAETKVLNITLNQYEVDFTNDGTGFDKTTNRIVLDLDAAFVFAAGNNLSSTDAISYSAVMSGASTKVIFGDFKQADFSVNSQSISLDFFDNFGDGSITFSEASMKIEAYNGLGIPLGVDMSGISASNGSGSVTLDYATRHADDNAAPAQYMVFGGVETFTTNPQPKLTTRVLDKNNSNINELLSSKPTQIDLVLEGKINPITNGTNENFYDVANSGITVDVTVNVPMDIQFDDVNVDQDPIEFDFAEDIEDITNVKLSLTTINSIPLSGVIDVVFLKDGVDLNITKSIAGFDAAPVDNNGVSNGSTTKKSDLDFTESEFETLKEATHVKLEIAFATPQGKTVKLLGTDEIKAMINIEAQLEITEEDNN